LEALFDNCTDRMRLRDELSREADASFQEQAEQSAGAVLASWWKHPRTTAESGTPTKWLAALPGVKVEVHCQCSAEVAARRFLDRKRHAGHLDDRWSHAQLLASMREQASLGPLGLGSLVIVSTESIPDMTAVLEQLAAEFR